MTFNQLRSIRVGALLDWHLLSTPFPTVFSPFFSSSFSLSLFPSLFWSILWFNQFYIPPAPSNPHPFLIFLFPISFLFLSLVAFAWIMTSQLQPTCKNRRKKGPVKWTSERCFQAQTFDLISYWFISMPRPLWAFRAIPLPFHYLFDFVSFVFVFSFTHFLEFWEHSGKICLNLLRFVSYCSGEHSRLRLFEHLKVEPSRFFYDWCHVPLFRILLKLTILKDSRYNGIIRRFYFLQMTI